MLYLWCSIEAAWTTEMYPDGICMADADGVQIVEPTIPPFEAAYFRKSDNTWITDKNVPTQWPSLIRRASPGRSLRPVAAVLELKAPYVVEVERQDSRPTVDL